MWWREGTRSAALLGEWLSAIWVWVEGVFDPADSKTVQGLDTFPASGLDSGAFVLGLAVLFRSRYSLLYPHLPGLSRRHSLTRTVVCGRLLCAANTKSGDGRSRRRQRGQRVVFCGRETRDDDTVYDRNTRYIYKNNMTSES